MNGWTKCADTEVKTSYQLQRPNDGTRARCLVSGFAELQEVDICRHLISQIQAILMEDKTSPTECHNPKK